VLACGQVVLFALVCWHLGAGGLAGWRADVSACGRVCTLVYLCAYVLVCLRASVLAYVCAGVLACWHFSAGGLAGWYVGVWACVRVEVLAC
jgi:hypothetical protein